MEYKTNPVKAIRDKCLDCCCSSTLEVKECAVVKCPIYPYRMGQNPFRKGREMTDEQKEMAVERLARAREAKQT